MITTDQKKHIDICVIEDDEVDVLVLRNFIDKNQLPYRVKITHSLFHAKELLNNHSFDIIIADYNLPDGNIFNLQQLFLTTPVILLTGLGNEEIAAKALEFNIADYLIKDAERNYLKLLSSRIDTVLQKKCLINQLNERLKEMTCLYEVQKVLDSELSEADLVGHVMQSLAKSMQFSEYVCIEIYLDNKQYCSKGYIPRKPQCAFLQAEIYVKKLKRGQIRIHYAVEKSFLIPEERNLLLAVAKDFGLYLERKENSENLRIAAISFESLDGIIILNQGGNVIRSNSSFCKLTGYREEEVTGHHFSKFMVADSRSSIDSILQEVTLNSTHLSGETNIVGKNGKIIPVRIIISTIESELRPEEIKNYVITLHDLSFHKAAERQIHMLRYFDALTGLPNINQFNHKIELAIKDVWETKNGIALLLIDIDHFKTINDVAGHNIGDAILSQFGNRMLGCVKEHDFVARMEGNTFSILVNKLRNDDALIPRMHKIAERIRSIVTKPYLVANKNYHVMVSIGIGLMTQKSTMADLFKQANTALLKGKELGGNRIHFFDVTEQIEIEEWSRFEFELYHIVFDEQLRMHYQIQVNSNNTIVGVEALIRWHHPELGIISPAKFIPIAEESSLSLEIGQWVLETACNQLASWSKSIKTKYLTIAINISSKQFHDRYFAERVRESVIKHGIAPSLLKLELTEGIVMDHVHAIQQIAELRKIGVTLALDDFGTSYSSLSYLKKLDVDQLKIDQSFVRDISVDSDGGMMTKTIIDLARNFQLEVLAEGVETEDQLKFLKKNNCNLFQGYLFGKPLPIEELEFLLIKYQSLKNYSSTKNTLFYNQKIKCL